MTAQFTHLHIHTEYSILDGACRFNSLFNKIKNSGMDAVAITDSANLFGSINFYEKAIACGIKPIIGCEVFITRNRFEKAQKGIRDPMYKAVLLAQNLQGYQNLTNLVTSGYLEGFYYRPRIDKEILKKYSSDIIALISYEGGEISRNFLDRNLDTIDSVISSYTQIFGNEKLFFELQRLGKENDTELNQFLIEKAKEHHIRVVATNHVYYVEPEEKILQEIVNCIYSGHTLTDEKRRILPTNEFYVKSAESMIQLFEDIPEAIENTQWIKEHCNIEFNFGETFVPKFIPPNGLSDCEYLRELCKIGLNERYPNQVTDEISQRLEKELKIIEGMHYVSYFLIVWDFVDFAIKNNIPVGPGRGSAAGSLVAYLLKITDIDPLKYQLIFERFLNPDRVSMPDIDIDFSDDDRGKMIEYVSEKYGKDRVSQIITFGTMGAKAALRDVGRVMGMTYADVDKIAKLIPNELKITLEDSLEKEPELKKLYQSESQIHDLIDYAKKLEGTVRNLSIHAAGVVIGSEPLVNRIPLCTGSKGEIATQFPMGQVEKLGLLKMDFLGLRTLKVIQEAIEIVKSTHQTNLDISQIDLDDQKTLTLINDGKTIGVFQLESGGMRDLARKMGIDRFDDLIALVALYRPGPMHMADEYIKRKKGKIKIKYDHNSLIPILKDTHGIMLYQEQVMQVAGAMGGYSMAQADNLRRIMGKKIHEKMVKEKETFVNGALELNHQKKIADKVFEDMAYFAGYGFNKSHSAAYALISFRTAFLKANYPHEYMAALLSSELNNPDKISLYLSEAKEMKIEILPPDVNESQQRFSVIQNKIRFGLSAIKNVGGGVVEQIIHERDLNGPYTSFKDFVDRNDAKVTNHKTMESLIRCGAFDSFKHHRSQLESVLDEYVEISQKLKKEANSNQASFFDVFEQTTDDFKNDTRSLPKIDEWDDLKKLKYERELLGFYVTGHPLDPWVDQLEQYTNATTDTLKDIEDQQEVVIGGIISKSTVRLTKKRNEKMAILSFSDMHGVCEAICFPKIFEQKHSQIEEDRVVVIMGKVDQREANPKIIVNDILSPEDCMAKIIKTVNFNVELTSIKQDQMIKLHEIITKYPGKCPVKFKCLLNPEKYVIVSLDSKYWVTPCDDLIDNVEKLLGKNKIYLIKNLETQLA